MWTTTTNHFATMIVTQLVGICATQSSIAAANELAQKHQMLAKIILWVGC